MLLKGAFTMHKTYEMVIGLEVHVELKTASKIFCGCKTHFGASPNTQVCPVCLGLPGSLPVLNEKVVEYAVTAGLATHCTITKVGKQDRKNYFYPDLAKAYQISQYDQPICEHGFIKIEDKTLGSRIGITRIHIEEDAGKLTHHKELGTLIDYNRAGVPLIEIVSEPDIRSALQAKLYLQKLRGIILYTGISDCKMNEGSFRCDVNLSIRKKGETTLGTRTEMKNLNSFSSINKAIEHEFLRQIKLVQAGGKVVQESRKWDQDKNKSISMRTKEDAHDYRYFPDPDLKPIIIGKSYIERLNQALPELPEAKKVKYTSAYDLTVYEAEQIALDRQVAEFYEETLTHYYSPKLTASVLISELIKLKVKSDDSIRIKASQFAGLIHMIDSAIINNSIAKKVLVKMWDTEDTSACIVEREALQVIKDETILLAVIKPILKQNTKIISDYLGGKEKALQSLVGQVMKATQGKAEPEKTMTLIIEEIKKV